MALCSPRTWGWTGVGHERILVSIVFPTHVGMDRTRALMARLCSRVPHARGDGPFHGNGRSERLQCSPRTWGWTVRAVAISAPAVVFPTHVGMDRSVAMMLSLMNRVPHARGDGPRLYLAKELTRECSPRTWGWTDPDDELIGRELVFPTHVGMDRRVQS